LVERIELSTEHLWALALPKAEQHVHDVGSLPVSMLLEFAEKNGVTDLPEHLRQGTYDFGSTGLAGFVAMYVAACAALTNPDDYRELGKSISIAQRAQNVLYSRVHHTPAIPGARDGNWAEPLEGLLAGFCDGLDEGGALCHLLIDIPAEFDQVHPGNNFREQTIDVAIANKVSEHHVPGVVAVGVAGVHINLVWSSYSEMLTRAKGAGLEVAVHAGESLGPKTIDEVLALEGAQPDRIEHGLSAIQDEETLTRIVDLGIPLDMGIGSNFVLGNLDQLGLETHPFLEMHRRGVRVTLNTDDPSMFQTDMVNEYVRALRLGAQPSEVAEMAAVAWDDPYIPSELRTQALAQIDKISGMDIDVVAEDMAGAQPELVESYKAHVQVNQTKLV
jgi:aminodeoxyfutalosine deaminase